MAFLICPTDVRHALIKNYRRCLYKATGSRLWLLDEKHSFEEVITA